jgi:deazaflavin-dependent oxidoreductase (nitroreductase family)
VSNRWRDFNQNLIQDMRAHGGRPTSGPFLGRDVLILTTKGAKTGEIRENPLAYSRDDGHYVVVASRGGSPRNPAWYHNLRANPVVTVEVLGDRFDALAEVIDGEDYERLYQHHARLMPAFNEYRQRTSRKIPVIVLERIEPEGRG